MTDLLVAVAPAARAEKAVLPGTATAAAPAAVRAERAIDGDTLLLADGSTLRLAGILAPKAGDRGPARDIAAIAAAARAALDDLARGGPLAPVPAGTGQDRHGRRVAFVRDAAGRWLQDELLRRGLARVFTQPDTGARGVPMLALEAEARAAKRGLWALPAYAVRSDGEAARFSDSFQIVEGRVVKAAAARDVYYLNFSDDYRRDFTIGLDRAALRAARRGGLDPARLEGKRVRVRGWVLWRNGPYIGATHAEQIEVLD